MRDLKRRYLLLVFLFALNAWPSKAVQIIEVRPVKRVGQIFSREVGGAQLLREVRAVRPSEFASYDPKRAEILREYDVQEILAADYQLPPGVPIRAELYRLANFVSSYGLYSFDRLAVSESAGAGGASWLTSQAAGMWQGEYYLRAQMNSASQRTDGSKALTAMAAMVSRRLVVRPFELPWVIRALPQAGMVEGTQRFVSGPQSLARFGGYDNPNDLWLLAGEGSEAAIADYRAGTDVIHLMVAEYHTPQLAHDAYQRVRAYLDMLPAAERARRILEREGNYIIGAFEVSDRGRMQELVDQIRYQKIVKWLKPDPPISLQVDPNVIAIRYYLTAFLFTGLVLLLTIAAGALVGGSLFLYRRRKLRMLPGFTDAGGMMRLNLDNLVLPPIDRPRKQLTG